MADSAVATSPPRAPDADSDRVPPSGRLPHSAPRPPHELAELKRIWRSPSGWRIVTDVNNTVIGLLYLGTAMLFFVLAGLVALVMRTQLAVPQNQLVGPDLYNQLFTMHGTTMMFLFAVPAVEAVSVYLLPNMQAARDLPFPRLSAYSYWAYTIGGLVFFSSIFFGAAPDAGWFMYPPLSSALSPGIRADFWLLGIGFIEISAIAGAIEIIVGVLRTRAPGMSIDKLPVFAWAMFVVACMIVVAFPSIIIATMLLELERALDWPFFRAEKGGDPLLWQHLFWFFGHPEVYIIFLPAAGMVSMILPAMVQAPLYGYRAVVLSLIATGLLSFGLWVHHMFTTGLPKLSMSFFTVASMLIAIPSGLQVFCWIATIMSGRLRLATPALFVLGFLVIFVIGGLTGVMVAVVPINLAVHDTYFVVAHFHYVLIGGMVFPLFAAFYYWAPLVSRRPLSERLGRWVFGLMFVGTNVAFFPMHVTGLAGMPRRVYTYLPGMGWEGLNLASTLGAFLIACGVLVFIVDLLRNLRVSQGDNAGNVWHAGTLEWLPNEDYGTRSIPAVDSLYPLWKDRRLARDVEEGRYYLPDAPTGGRETIVTSPVEGRPQYVVQLPGPGWGHFVGAVFTAAFFLFLTVQLYVPAIACGVVALAAVVWWLWDTDPGPAKPAVDIGGGLLPTYVTGPISHAWWAMIVLIVVAAMAFGSLVFSYLYLWSVNAPGNWLPRRELLPSLSWPLASAVLYAASAAAIAFAGRALGSSRSGAVPALIVVGLTALFAAFAVDGIAQWRHGLRPRDGSYDATIASLLCLQGFFVATIAAMGLYTVARWIAGRLDVVRRATFDNTMLLWHYTAAQGLIGLALTYGFPRLTGAG
jgi:cytochrome c oxidase subunit I+III